MIYIHVYNNIGVSLKKQEKFDDALEYFQRSFKIALAASEPNPELIAIICTNVADILLAQNQIEPAITCVKSALDIALQHLPSNNPSLASIYLSQGESEDALNHYENCLQIKLVILPSDHPQLASLYASIASAQILMGHCDEALDNSRKTLDITMKVFDEHDTQRIACQENFQLINEIIDNMNKNQD